MDTERRKRTRETPDRRREIIGDVPSRAYAVVAVFLALVFTLIWASLL
jgi:hypothetical protein